MSFEILTLATLRTNGLAAIRSRFSGRDTSPESLFAKTNDALAAFLWDLQLRAQSAYNNRLPNESSDYESLALAAFVYGLSDGADGYGPKSAILATGLVGTATGTPASTIPDGTVLVASDGETLFEVDGLATVGGGGSVSITINATTAGADGNLEAGDVLTFESPPGGVDASVTITAGATNGADKEDADALLRRLLNFLQNPPRAITAPDVRAICEGVTGIDRAYVYPRRNGTGTFDVVITQAGTGTARRPTSYLSAVETAVEDDRNVTVEDARVLLPTMDAADALSIRIRGIPTTGNAFDWDDTAASVPTVKAGGTTTLLRINGSMPAAFTTAWNNAAVGSKPRIQIANTTSGAPVLAEQRRVTAIDTATINPDTILTLDEALTIYPTAADAVYAGGPVVETIQEDVLEYVDSRGPSTASGYQDDDTDSWEDDVQIGQLMRVALDAVDESGDRLLSNIVFSGTTPQVTLNGSVADYEPTDNTTNPPKMAFAKLVLVTR